MINVKAYTPMRFGRDKYRLRYRQRPRQREWVCTELAACCRWVDLYRLAKWHFVVCFQDYLGRCWPRLAAWAWDDYADQDWSATCDQSCKQEAREARDGKGCWCGKYRSETA